MTAIYSTEVLICATAYIAAANAVEAAEIANARFGDLADASVVSGVGFGDDGVETSEASYETLLADGVEVTLSPAMTFHGKAEGGKTPYGPDDLAWVEGEEADDPPTDPEPVDIVRDALAARLGEAAAVPLVDAVFEALELAGYSVSPTGSAAPDPHDALPYYVGKAIAGAKPGEPATEEIGRFATLAEAEACIEARALTDPQGVAAGDYGIDGPEA